MVICETKQWNNETTTVPNSLGISNKVLLGTSDWPNSDDFLRIPMIYHYSHMLFEKCNNKDWHAALSGKHGRLGHVIEQEKRHAVARWQEYVFYLVSNNMDHGR